MQLNNANNLNFGMARIKGGFHKIAVDALMEAHGKGPQALSAVRGDLSTIGRTLDGDILVQITDKSKAIIFQDRHTIWDRIRGIKKTTHFLHPIRNGESPITTVASTAEAIERYSDLFERKRLCPTLDDLKDDFKQYVIETNRIFARKK